MTDAQLIRNAQNPYLYGRFLDVGTAFNKGLVQASSFGRTQITDPVKAVKNNYEDQLEKYLNKLPEDVDLGGVPEKYRNNIANFLMTQKQNYVTLANQVNEYEVGSEMYMGITNQMNEIRNSFENLDSQMKIYGSNKKELVNRIKDQSTSLSPENQANVNLLRSVYNEEFDLNIDEYGNVSFIGDDGQLNLNDLPGYEGKDYKTAQNMMKMGVNAYNNGVVLKPGDVMYSQYRNQLKLQIDAGGRNTLMSVIHDGLVGDIRMIDNPIIARNLEDYKNGNLSFEGLRDVVVDNYMDVIKASSESGYKAKQTRIARSQARRSGTYGGRDYKSPITEYSPKYGEKVIIQMPYDLDKNAVRIMSLTGEKLEGFDDMQMDNTQATPMARGEEQLPSYIVGEKPKRTESAAPTQASSNQNEIQEMIKELKKINPGQTPEYYKNQAKKALGI